MSTFRAPYTSVICSSAEAEQRTYRPAIGTSGRLWLIACQPNAADNVYCSGGRDSEGFGGREISFTLQPSISGRIILKGPWHSNADALFNDTGVDVRNTCETFGAVGKKRSYGPHMETIIDDVLYQDEKPTIGPYSRIKDKAQELANEIGEQVFYYSQTRCGSSSGPVKPEEAKQP